MHLVKTFLVLSLFLCSVTSTFIGTNITDFSKCKVHYSRSDVSYKQFFQVSDTLHRNGSNFDFHFSVLAPHDAHILLSPSAQITNSDPVYEIVLGAGMNTFSVIRRLQKSAAKQSRNTPNLLASLDVKSFWIHVSEDGLIEVGKDGDELAFLSWRDPDPLPIEVFSFCTWPGVEAKWYYDCVREDGSTSESQAIEEKLTTVEKLRKGLLKYYDPYAIPIIQPDDAIEIHMGLLYERVYLDEMSSKLIIDGTMQLEWIDPKISWLPLEFDNIKSLHFNFREIWQPDLMLYNSASGPGNNFLKSTNFNVNSEGRVFWVAQAHIETWCDASGLGQWPNDEHTCEIQLGFWTQQNYLFFQPYETANLVQQYKEWKITNVQSGYYLIATPWDRENSITSTFVIRFTLRRTTSTYTAVYFVPLVAVSISLLLTFWLTPSGPVRISLHCFQLVILSLMLTKLVSVVPAHPTHVPYIVLLYSYGFVAISFALIFTIILFNWSHTEHVKPVPYFVYKFLSLKYVQIILYVKGSKFSESYDKLIEEEPCTKEVDILEMWRMLGIAIDRLLFISYLLLILICLFQHY